MIIINSPSNPTGKVITYQELQEFADILKAFPRVVVLSDEVYEHIIFDDETILPRMATLKEMWNRTITVHSVGKFFSATGIRVAFTIAPEHLIKPLHAINQYNTLCMYGPMQSAVAESLEIANKPFKGYDNYFLWLRQHYQDSRDYFMKNLNEIEEFKGKFWKPEGAYFLMADISKSDLQIFI